MEQIIFDSRRYAKEVIYLYVHFYNFLFTQTLQRGVAPLSYNKGSCDGKTPEVLGRSQEPLLAVSKGLESYVTWCIRLCHHIFMHKRTF